MPDTRKILFPACLAGLAMIAMPLQAQLAPDASGKVFNIPRTEQAPVLDGKIDEPAWQQAAVRSDLYQRRPIEYRPASEPTDVYFMYDEDALYVAVYAHDSQPQEISANVLEQGGELWQDDNFTLMLDPFNSGTGGYQFQVNPNGVRSESIYTSPTRSSNDWEGIWTTAARIADDGWVAEMRIPFKSLSFDPANETWGVNFWRGLQRTQESMSWYSYNGSSNPTAAGTMVGIREVTQGLGLDVVPAISASHYENYQTDVSRSESQPSVDMFYKVTPQINLAVTVNTDFSATEADSNSLNLDRFRQFFEEKRAFFLNDFDIFNFGLAAAGRMQGLNSGNNAIAFYSRSIGLSDRGQPVDIDGGIKLSGRVGNTEFGTLIMRQQEHTNVSRNGTVENIGSDTALVARIQQPVLGESKLGLIFTDGSPRTNEDNSLMGIDLQYRDSSFVTGKSMDAVLMYQQSDTQGISDDQAAYSAVVSVGGNTGWSGGAQYFAVEDNYSPQLGFTQRTNAALYSFSLQHEWLFEDHSWIQDIRSSVSARRWEELDSGIMDSENVRFTLFNINSVRGDRISINTDRGKELVRGGQRTTGDLAFNIPEGIYNETGYSFSYNTPNHWDWSSRVNLSYSDYFTGTRTRYGIDLGWQLNRYLSFDGGVTLSQYDLPEGTTYTRELEFDVEISFGPSVSLSSQLEFDNVRRELNFNNRLRWNIQPGQDVWVVLNHGLIDQDIDNRFANTTTNAAFKFRYTYRF